MIRFINGEATAVNTGGGHFPPQTGRLKRLVHFLFENSVLDISNVSIGDQSKNKGYGSNQFMSL
jgi:hypothetical protein